VLERCNWSSRSVQRAFSAGIRGVPICWQPNVTLSHFKESHEKAQGWRHITPSVPVVRTVSLIAQFPVDSGVLFGDVAKQV